MHFLLDNLRARVKSEEKRKERATLTMNAWFLGGAIRAIIGKSDPLCGAAQHTDVWGVPSSRRRSRQRPGTSLPPRPRRDPDPTPPQSRRGARRTANSTNAGGVRAAWTVGGVAAPTQPGSVQVREEDARNHRSSAPRHPPR